MSLGFRFGGCVGVLGCFVDVDESLAGCSIGSAESLAIGTLDYYKETTTHPKSGF